MLASTSTTTGIEETPDALPEHARSPPIRIPDRFLLGPHTSVQCVARLLSSSPPIVESIKRARSRTRAIRLRHRHPTVRYLKIEADDALVIAEQTQVQSGEAGRGRRTRRSRTDHQLPLTDTNGLTADAMLPVARWRSRRLHISLNRHSGDVLRVISTKRSKPAMPQVLRLLLLGQACLAQPGEDVSVQTLQIISAR